MKMRFSIIPHGGAGGGSSGIVYFTSPDNNNRYPLDRRAKSTCDKADLRRKIAKKTVIKTATVFYYITESYI